jgi:alkylation response protein AidB-like acyl-CoA dehydrogenase
MPLVLNDEQGLLRDSARGFLAKNAPISHLRKLRDSRDETGFSRVLWKQFAEMGFAGILIPEEFGGAALGYVEAGVVMEEIGRTLTPSPFLSTALLCAGAIARAGSEAQKKEHLGKIAAGERIGAFAIDEHSKHNPAKIALSAKRSGNGFSLNGSKGFVVDGHVADFLIVAARTSSEPGDTKGITLFIVDPKTKGIETERTIMVDSHNAARISFDNAQVNADAVLGEVDQGWKILDGALNVGRATVASELVGAGEEAVRQADRRIPGAATPRGASLQRDRNYPRRGAEGAADAGRAFRSRRLDRIGRQGPRRRERHARGAGSGANAWRLRHDR